MTGVLGQAADPEHASMPPAVLTVPSLHTSAIRGQKSCAEWSPGLAATGQLVAPVAGCKTSVWVTSSAAQVCAALAATVASSTSAPLQPEGAATAPADFLCPISQQLMVEPALLVETGHSFEATNIRRWLDINNTCPISRKQLHSKQLVPNLSLKRAIADWAACHGVIMPAAPTYASMHSSSLSAAKGSAADAAAAADQHEAQARASDAASAAASLGATGLTQPGQPGHGQSQGPFVVSLPGALSLKGAGRRGSGGGLRCTRTRWALGIAAALLVVAGIGAGVGVYLTVGRNKQGVPAWSPWRGAPGKGVLVLTVSKHAAASSNNLVHAVQLQLTVPC
jgi:hypothetical protein